MSLPILYRKRIIPDECIALKDDVILYIDDEIIVTKWNVLNPRTDFTHGYSCYFLSKNIKVSKFLKENGIKSLEELKARVIAHTGRAIFGCSIRYWKEMLEKIKTFDEIDDYDISLLTFTEINSLLKLLIKNTPSWH